LETLTEGLNKFADFSRGSKQGRATVDPRLIEELRYVFTCLQYELEHLDPEENEVCLLVSNLTDEVAGFLSGLDLFRESRA
jgi:hypothetical protein